LLTVDEMDTIAAGKALLHVARIIRSRRVGSPYVSRGGIRPLRPKCWHPPQRAAQRGLRFVATGVTIGERAKGMAESAVLTLTLIAVAAVLAPLVAESSAVSSRCPKSFSCSSSASSSGPTC
jgi:hypothetical protein